MRSLRYTAGALASLTLFSLVGCGGERASMDSTNNRAPIQRPAPAREGMSNRQKVMLVAGAAALYYLYNKHKDRQGHGSEGQYYRSKNGQVYFRDAKGKAHWVNPPSQPIQVPVEEYERFSGRRYDNYDGGVVREAPAGW